MRAFQTLRTKNNADFQIKDFEIFTMILSALEWQKFNGEIFLYTDSHGKNFLDSIGISEIWNGVYNSLDAMDNFDIDENIFWAGAKIFALAYNPPPCVMIDLDFIVWQPLNFDRFNSDIAVIHREEKNLPCYPDKNYFTFKNNFALPENLNWSLDPCNTAFAYFGDKNFVAKYRDFAFGFMHNAAPEKDKNGWDLLPYMVFVEQRWLAMCAEICNKKIYSFSNLLELFDDKQKFFTHLWGHKQFLRENPEAEEKFCRECAERIAYDFPKRAKNFSELNRLKNFF